MNLNKISPKVATMLADILVGVSKLEIDIMTITVESNGGDIEHFIYSIPGVKPIMRAKPNTWQHINPIEFKNGECITFLCIARFGPGYKSLTPVAVLERTKAPNNPKTQSHRWFATATQLGALKLLEFI